MADRKETKRLIVSLLIRGLFFSFVWWSLSGGAASSWWIGGPAVVLALTTSIALLPPQHLNGYALLRFIPFFLIRSLLGGVDVAWRAFHPRLPIDPLLIHYRLTLPVGLPQVVMINSVSLLPGTLSVAIDQQVLQLHVLSGGRDYLDGLQQLEQRVGRIFGHTVRGETIDETI
ncbi:hypothetical protein MNBD_GAMMA26-1761 [hydrothermal vent metagenome]|uniref:Na(+) H(+) antiporter subunit E n=1 Tax=hydrothermal vent metagenome TaxID=652676 RepID=A0A3B1AVQ1_9ZZZZ